MTEELSIQERYVPKNACFGCGPSNEKGLRIRSFADTSGAPCEGKDPCICDWTPEPHHQAFPGMVNGGIIGALLDCHGNWTAAWHLMQRDGLDEPPCTVTASYEVKLRRPTPYGPLHLRAWVTESSEDRAHIAATLEADGKVCATCTGLFVAVKEDHPAYHRW